jgi:hypothetical protein
MVSTTSPEIYSCKTPVEEGGLSRNHFDAWSTFVCFGRYFTSVSIAPWRKSLEEEGLIGGVNVRALSTWRPKTLAGSVPQLAI